MPQPTQSASGENPPEGKTLVRGADGALYLVSKHNPPEPLTEKEADKLLALSTQQKRICHVRLTS